MKVTNKKALDLAAAVKLITEAKQLQIKGIVWLRNARVLTPIVEEFQAILPLVTEDFKKVVEIDEAKYGSDQAYVNQINYDFAVFQESHEELQKFLTTEVDLALATFPESDIEHENFDAAVVQLLIDTIITI